jgi:hypothetical protein
MKAAISPGSLRLCSGAGSSNKATRVSTASTMAPSPNEIGADRVIPDDT